MSSIIEGYNYDIFISYRQKDNKGDRWVSNFVDALKTELEATFKEDVSVYFDENPHDRLQETHNVDKSLEGKLNCLIFIPILSQTYCDPKSYAWQNEFLAFVKTAENDRFGKDVKLRSGNVAGRILPIRIHDLEQEDIKLFEKETGSVLRALDFVFKTSTGVSRPLKANEDHPHDNLNKTFYSDQINKVGHAIKEIILGMKTEPAMVVEEKGQLRESFKEVGEEGQKVEKARSTKAGKVKFLSVIAFFSLLLIAVIIAYPKIFKSTDNLQEMTMAVSVINENGEKEIRRVFKDEYIAKLSLFPFANEANDSSVNWLQHGITDAITEDLNQFNYVILGGTANADHLQEQIQYAKTNNFPYFLTGVFRITGGIYEITSRLYKTSNGTVEIQRTFKGNDFFSLIDSISLQTRIDLGISEKVLNSSPDLPFKEHSTNNFGAFRYYIRGLYIDSLYTNLNRSIELDSTFALASYKLALYNYRAQNSNESAHNDIRQAMRHRKRLSEYNDISTRILYYLILGKNDKAVTLSEMQYELQPHNILLLGRLLDTYNTNFMIYKYQKAAQKMTELVPNIPDYQINLARSYLFTAELNKGLEVLGKLLKVNPENVEALLLLGEIYLHKNDLEAAEKIYQKAILFQPENEKYWSRMFDHIAYLRNRPIKNNILEPFTGNYHWMSELNPTFIIYNSELNVTFFIHNNYLVGKGENQGPFFNYPVSDTQFVFINGLETFTFLRNNQGEVIKTIFKYKDFSSNINWKEDSLILKAMNSLNKDNKTDALYAFREAYAHNPEHYYLVNFIHHLEFIQRPEYKKIEHILETYTGKYGDYRIFNKNGNFYWEDINSFIFKLLPLSEEQFMIPYFNGQIQIIKEKASIKGLKYIFKDEKGEKREIFFARNN